MDSVSIVSAVVALAGAGLAAFFSYWQQRRLSVWEKHNYMDRYGASLAWAVFDLQSRLYNILHGQVVDRSPGPDVGYLTAFLVRGTPAEAEYARRSTVFVLAEYLAWAEVLRRDIQFLNLGSSRVNRKVMGQVSRVSADIFGHSSSIPVRSAGPWVKRPAGPRRGAPACEPAPMIPRAASRHRPRPRATAAAMIAANRGEASVRSCFSAALTIRPPLRPPSGSG